MRKLLQHRLTRLLILPIMIVIIIGVCWWYWVATRPTFKYSGIRPVSRNWELSPYDDGPGEIVSPDGRFKLIRTIEMPARHGCGNYGGENIDDSRGTVVFSVYDSHFLLRSRMKCDMYWPDDTYHYYLVLPGRKIWVYRNELVTFSPDSRYIIIPADLNDNTFPVVHYESLWSF